jgi:phage repressor protein C with HTH and peptisase S24 domain
LAVIDVPSRQDKCGVLTVFVLASCAHNDKSVSYVKREVTKKAFVPKMSDKLLEEIGRRLAFAVRKSGGNNVISEKTGITTRSLSRYLAGQHEMPMLTAVALAEATGVSLKWLLSGEDDDTNGANAEIVSLRRPDSAAAVGIPLLNVVGSAGHGVENGHVEELARLSFDASQLKRLGVRPEAAHFIIARGDSMEPTIQDGATVLIDASRTRVRDDGIYAIVVDGDVRLKRVQKKATGAIELISDNPRYMSETLSGDEVDRLMVAGKVFWSGGGV